MIKFGKDTRLSEYPAPFLIKLSEKDNCLRLVCSLARREKEQVSLCYIDNLTPIFPDEEEQYEIIFENYILYLTRNESYCSGDPKELKQGRYFIIYDNSKLLNTLPQLTDCQVLSDGYYYPDKWIHYGIYCQNHIIDVISCTEPVIRKL